MTTKSATYYLPGLSGDGGLSGYLVQIKKFPMLDAERRIYVGKKLEG